MALKELNRSEGRYSEERSKLNTLSWWFRKYLSKGVKVIVCRVAILES